MNWSRAKTILIAALIITNVFLIVTYGDFGPEAGGFRDYEGLSYFLAERNIYVDAKMIPDSAALALMIFMAERADREGPCVFVDGIEKVQDAPVWVITYNGVNSVHIRI